MSTPAKSKLIVEAKNLKRMVVVDVLCREDDNGKIEGMTKIKIMEKDLSKARIESMRKAVPMAIISALAGDGLEENPKTDPTGIFGILYTALASCDTQKAVQVMDAIQYTEDGDDEGWKMTLHDVQKKAPGEALLEEDEVVVFNPVFML